MAAQVEHVSLRDVLISMRASARTLFESGGDIHGRINAAMTGWRGAAGTPPCGFPVFLGQAGVKKELGIFDPSNTFLLTPALPAVLSGRPVAFGDFFRISIRGRSQFDSAPGSHSVCPVQLGCA